jgi:hypothetical protein
MTALIILKLILSPRSLLTTPAKSAPSVSFCRRTTRTMTWPTWWASTPSRSVSSSARQPGRHPTDRHRRSLAACLTTRVLVSSAPRGCMPHCRVNGATKPATSYRMPHRRVVCVCLTAVVVCGWQGGNLIEVVLIKSLRTVNIYMVRGRHNTDLTGRYPCLPCRDRDCSGARCQGSR